MGVAPSLTPTGHALKRMQKVGKYVPQWDVKVHVCTPVTGYCTLESKHAPNVFLLGSAPSKPYLGMCITWGAGLVASIPCPAYSFAP